MGRFWLLSQYFDNKLLNFPVFMSHSLIIYFLIMYLYYLNYKIYYIMIKWSIQEEDTKIVNIYASNIGAPQYIRQMLKPLKGKITVTQKCGGL